MERKYNLMQGQAEEAPLCIFSNISDEIADNDSMNFLLEVKLMTYN